MAELPPIRKLYLEDYASQKSWIGPLLIILNQFMTAVVTALTKGLTLIDNTTSDIKYVTLANVPTPTTNNNATGPTSVSWTKSTEPVAVLVSNVQYLKGSPAVNTAFTLAAAVQVQWQMSSDGKNLQIIGVTGIMPTQTNQYALTLVCVAG